MVYDGKENEGIFIRTIKRFQKSIEYDTSVRSRFGKPWESEELTEILGYEFNRTQGFTEVIEEMIISDSEEENNKEPKNSETSLYEELLGMGFEMEKSEVEKIEKLNIEKEIILTDEFMDKWWKISNFSEEKRLEEIREWSNRSVMNCNKCNKRRVRKYMHETEEELMLCKERKEKESKESDNESDMQKLMVEG
jgi:hypothetical protein